MNLSGRLFAVGMSLLPTFVQGQQPPEPPLEPVDRYEQSIPIMHQPSAERLVKSTVKAAASFKPKENEFYCYRYVKQGVRTALGVSLTGVHAYQAAEQLANSPCFKEIGGPRKSFRPEEAPRGAVVVWQASKKYPSGHIFVSMGKGQEVSDRIRPMATQYGSVARIFLPQECAPTTP